MWTFARRLPEGGQAAIDESTDPLIQLAKLMEPEARENRKVRDELQERERQAYAQITAAQLRGGRHGHVSLTRPSPCVWPSARSPVTMRTVSRSRRGPRSQAPSSRRNVTVGKDPWQLPESWHAGRERLDKKTPFNFVSTADIIGGNSGSPVINRKGEFVGIIFDGNIQSLTARYFFSDKVARAVSMHSSVILEALTKVYGADRLMNELATDGD